jgi:hypothetical protein
MIFSILKEKLADMACASAYHIPQRLKNQKQFQYGDGEIIKI